MEPSFLTDMLAPVKTLTTTNSTSPPAFSSASRKTHFFREKSEGNTSAFFSHQPTRSSAFYKQRLCDVHASAHASPPLQEPLKVETRSTAFKILPPRLPITYFIDSIEIPPHQVNPEEEYYINPSEFEIQSISRLTAPAGRVVYQVQWKDGHFAEIPPSTIYEHVSEAQIEKLENDYFKHNNNPETLYDDDPDYPGGAPTGGTIAFQRGWFPGSRRAKARLVPEERELRLKLRLGDLLDNKPRRTPGSRQVGRPTGRPAGRPAGKPPARRAARRPAGRPPGRPSGGPRGKTRRPRGMRVRRKITDVDTPMEGVSSLESDEMDEDIGWHADVYSALEQEAEEQVRKEQEQEREDGQEYEEIGEDEMEEETEDEGEEVSYEEELAAQLAQDASFPRSDSRMSVDDDPPTQGALHLVQTSYDEVDSDLGMDTDNISGPTPPNRLSPTKAPKPISPQPPKQKITSLSPRRPSIQLPITSMLKRLDTAAAARKLQAAEAKPLPLPPPIVQPSPSRGLNLSLLSAGALFTPSTASSFSSMGGSFSVKGVKQVSRSLKSLNHSPVASNMGGGRVRKRSVTPSVTAASTPARKPPPSPGSIRFTPVNASPFHTASNRTTPPHDWHSPTPVSKLFPNTTIATSPSFSTMGKTPSQKSASKATPKPNPRPTATSKPKLAKSKSGSRSRTHSGSDLNDSPPLRAHASLVHPNFDPGDYEDFGLEPEEYSVEKVLAFRRVDGRKLYLVKWEGYTEDQSTWEPVENLQGSIDMVEEFERKRLRGG